MQQKRQVFPSCVTENICKTRSCSMSLWSISCQLIHLSDDCCMLVNVMVMDQSRVLLTSCKWIIPYFSDLMYPTFAIHLARKQHPHALRRKTPPPQPHPRTHKQKFQCLPCSCHYDGHQTHKNRFYSDPYLSSTSSPPSAGCSSASSGSLGEGRYRCSDGGS